MRVGTFRLLGLVSSLKMLIGGRLLENVNKKKKMLQWGVP